MRAISLLCMSLAAQSTLVRTGVEQFGRGHYDAARVTLEQAVKQTPGDPHGATFLALARAATGGCERAAPDLDSQFQSAGNLELRRLAGIGLVQCHFAANRLDLAQPVVRRLVQEFPADADVLYQAAKLHMRAWNDVVHQMFEKTPASYRVNQLSAEVFETQGRYAEAVGEYRKAIAKNPIAVNLHYRLGRALLMESHAPEALDNARREFEAELALNPNDAVAEYQIGQILVAGQKNPDALKRFERAISLTPDFAEALVALGKLRLEMKHPDAIRLLERAVQLQPKNESARYSLMIAYRDAGRADDAHRQKEELDRLQRPPEGEFTEFLKKLGEKAPRQ